MEKRPALGKGLSALIPDLPAAGPARSPVELDVDWLEPSEFQPRLHMDEAALDELARSIAASGIIQPVVVRKVGAEKYQIIAGERRWRAAQGARLTEVPIIVRQMDDLEVLEVAIIENVQRADLNPLEEALAYASLMERFGRTQDAVAGIVGKSRSHVANTLRLTYLTPRAKELVSDGVLSAGHARALLTAKDPDALAEKIVLEGLNVRQTEALARKSQGAQPKSRAKAQPSSSPDTAALEQDLADALGLKVTLADRGGKGELTLSYANLEQLDDLCRRLMRG
jgi:ParB family chromosome partitioning protein